MARKRIFKFIDNAAPAEEQVKEVEARGFKEAVKSYQTGAKSKLVTVEWTTKRGEEFIKLQQLPLGRKKKIGR